MKFRRLTTVRWLALMVAAGLLAACGASSGTHRGIASVSTTPTPTTLAPTEQVSEGGVWDRLAVIAHQAAIEFGDPTPQTAEGVATKLPVFERATGTAVTSGAEGVEVYFVLMQGHFRCGPTCFNVSAHAPTGTYLSLAIDAKTLAISGTSLTNTPVDLQSLGDIHHL